MAIEPHQLLAYASGSLSLTVPPAWWDQHIDHEEGGWEESLKAQDVLEIEQFGEAGDFITIYRAPNGYYVEYCDAQTIIAHIFINEVSDYLHFRIHWIKPLVELIALSDGETLRKISKG